MRLAAALLLTLALPLAMAGSSEDADALFDAEWQWRLQDQPEFATTIGEHRYDSQLTDTSLAGCRARWAQTRRLLEQARAISREQLPAAQKLSLDLFIGEKERQARAGPCPTYPITSYAGLQTSLPRLVASMPFADEADYRAYIARLQALPAHVDGIIEQLREGLKSGASVPRAVMRPVPALLQQLREQALDGPLGQPLRQLPATIDAEAREALAADGMAALKTKALPALQALEDYLRKDYLPQARDSIAAPAEQYALLVAANTGGMTAAQVHALGLKEVARLKAEATQAIARTGFKGSFKQFASFATSDKRLFTTSEAALLERYRRSVARAAAALPALFYEENLPELLVKPAAPLGAAASGEAWYDAGADDRPAALVVNTSRLDQRPIWDVENIALHEGIPGHHLQFAHARRLALPPFRRHFWDMAYGEGWALYAESLAPELGLARDAFTEFGYLNAQLLRAARLVLDTGIHAFGWSRQQALDYLAANTVGSAAGQALEVDRYIAWPGQALAYHSGAAAIRALRDKAQTTLGKGFDIKAFHAAVLDQGALPLPLLERQMGQWIAEQMPRK